MARTVFKTFGDLGGRSVRVGHGVQGYDEMRRKLAQLIEEYPKMVAAAAFTEMNIEKEESMRITPRESGALRDSHEVQPPEIVAGRIWTAITVGNDSLNNRGQPTYQYAAPVHEDLEAFHDEGEAKFLEKTLRKSAKFMAERIGKRVRMRLEAVGAK